MSKRDPRDRCRPVLVFTDGASSGNPGPGGWGAVIATGDGNVLELGGSEEHSTNNRMELLAALEALRVCSQVRRPITIYTDSSYLVQGILSWLSAWKRRGWLTTQKKPVLNRDLWQLLDAEIEGRDLTWTSVPGHAGLPGNERADRIATGFSKGRDVELYCGSEADYDVDLRAPLPDGKRNTSKRRSRPGKAHAYLSLVEGVWRRHDTWAECQGRVKGVSNARFQKVMSEAEIDEVLAKWGVTP